MAAADTTLIVKTWLGEDCRRLVLDTPSLAHLRSKASEAYQLDPNLLQLKYKDADGDLITLAHERDFQTMLTPSHGGSRDTTNPIRIWVFVPTDEVDPDASRFVFEQPAKIDRSRFAENFSEHEMLDVLRDISYYVYARDRNPFLKSVASEKTLFRPEEIQSLALSDSVNLDQRLVTSASSFAFQSVSLEQIQSWSLDDVIVFLHSLKLDGYDDMFRENHITGDVLLDLTVESLKDIGVVSTGHRLRLLRAITTLRAVATANSKNPAR